jgi:hypothetical protein
VKKNDEQDKKESEIFFRKAESATVFIDFG